MLEAPSLEGIIDYGGWPFLIGGLSQSLEGIIVIGGWGVVLAIPDWWPLALRTPAA